MTPFDVSLFRTSFPEFANVTTYPDSQIQFWGGLAIGLVRPCVWGAYVVLGQSLYVAHEITIAAQSAAAAAIGGVPGVSGGIANTKTVGSVSVGYDTVTTSEKDGGWWNQTLYGRQFLRYARIFGAGVIQL